MNRRVTTQDVSWFLDLHANNQLDLNPPYQRRSVWSPKDRRYFLDTIFREFPSPSIFLHKETAGDGRTIYRVVDGKQRLETIINFTLDRIAIDKEYGDSRLAGKKWKHIRQDPGLARRFWDYVLPVEFINVAEAANYVNEVFDRLNRNSRRLVAQELRHAKYAGWFISFVEEESLDPGWQGLGVVTTARAKRMSDVQFLSELLIVLLKGEIGGFDQGEIDDFYARYDDPTEDLEEGFHEEELRKRFADTKNWLLELEADRSLVATHAKDFKDLYSLWAVIILKPKAVASIADFGEKYEQFMQEVEELKGQEDLDTFLETQDRKSYHSALRYFQNSIGANTEQPQRVARHEALLSLLENLSE